MRIVSVGRALPAHYYDQSTLLEAFKRLWQPRGPQAKRLESLHQHVLVGGRHLALPLEAYAELPSFTAANNAFISCAVELGERAIADGLAGAGLQATEIDHLFFVSVTGIATPSIDARLANRMGLRRDVKRTPIFGLGCVAGAVGVTRAADYVRAYPDQVAVLLSVELCSLTLQRQDMSVPNMIASGLFGDGAAAVVMVGAQHGGDGPEIVATRSVLYPHTERAMGWDVTGDGFRVVLSAEVPTIIARHTRHDVDGFLADHGLRRDDIGSYVCHPGGPRILEALQQSLELPETALAVTWDHLQRCGNLSSASCCWCCGRSWPTIDLRAEVTVCCWRWDRGSAPSWCCCDGEWVRGIHWARSAGAADGARHQPPSCGLGVSARRDRVRAAPFPRDAGIARGISRRMFGRGLLFATAVHTRARHTHGRRAAPVAGTALLGDARVGEALERPRDRHTWRSRDQHRSLSVRPAPELSGCRPRRARHPSGAQRLADGARIHCGQRRPAYRAGSL